MERQVFSPRRLTQVESDEISLHPAFGIVSTRSSIQIVIGPHSLWAYPIHLSDEFISIEPDREVVRYSNIDSLLYHWNKIMKMKEGIPSDVMW